jgi:hypothetical protein
MPNHNTHYIVKNINHTSGRSCNCKSWLEHWYRGTGQSRTTCCVIPCSKKAEVGAHVLLTDGRRTGQWWIVPMCKEHNHHTNKADMVIDSRTDLISANVSQTCG